MGLIRYLGPGASDADFRQYETKRAKRPRHITLLVPHTSELPAVSSLQEALADRLMQEGSDVSVKRRRDMMKKIWRLKKSEEGQNAEDNIFNNVLTLEDVLRRATALHRALCGHDDSMAVELHAYPRGKEKSWDDREWLRVGEYILAHSSPVHNLINIFNRCISEGMFREYMHSNSAGAIWYPSSAPSEQFQRAANVIRLDIKEAVAELRHLLAELKSMSENIELIELPSWHVRLDPRNPMYSEYYGSEHIDGDGNRLRGDVEWATSKFEYAYARGYWHSDFGKGDVDSLLPLFGPINP